MIRWWYDTGIWMNEVQYLLGPACMCENRAQLVVVIARKRESVMGLRKVWNYRSSKVRGSITLLVYAPPHTICTCVVFRLVRSLWQQKIQMMCVLIFFFEFYVDLGRSSAAVGIPSGILLWRFCRTFEMESIISVFWRGSRRLRWRSYFFLKAQNWDRSMPGNFPNKSSTSEGIIE